MIKKNKCKFDNNLFILICILISIGLLVLASASSYSALSNYGNSSHFLSRQLMFAIIGIVIMLVISKFDYRLLMNKKLAYLTFIFVLVLMLLVLVPGIGVTVKGATRWIGFGILQFQPSEIMKFVLVIATSAYIANNYKKLRSIWNCYIPVLMFGLVVGAMVLQDHLSGTVIMAAGLFGVILSSSVEIKKRQVIIGLILVFAVGAGFILSSGFRMQRVMGFLNPEADPSGSNWQGNQSLYALGTGSIFGLGFGQSRQKFLWLPEAQNDFIFSILGEEMGIIGTITVLILFALFVCKGYKIAMTSRDLFGCLVASGITTVFAAQIIINIAVVTGAVPVTGMPLPFFSYGGTALVINLASMGILLNISRNCVKK